MAQNILEKVLSEHLVSGELRPGDTISYRVDQVLLLSQPGELHFQPPVRVTSTAFNPHTPTGGGKHGAWWIGDYQGITAGDGAFHLMWNDARTGKLDLYAATVRP